MAVKTSKQSQAQVELVVSPPTNDLPVLNGEIVGEGDFADYLANVAIIQAYAIPESAQAQLINLQSKRSAYISSRQRFDLAQDLINAPGAVSHIQGIGRIVAGVMREVRITHSYSESISPEGQAIMSPYLIVTVVPLGGKARASSGTRVLDGSKRGTGGAENVLDRHPAWEHRKWLIYKVAADWAKRGPDAASSINQKFQSGALNQARERASDMLSMMAGMAVWKLQSDLEKVKTITDVLADKQVRELVEAANESGDIDDLCMEALIAYNNSQVT